MLDLGGLQLRAACFSCIRSFFTSKGFLEVDTPLRLPVLLPERHILPIPSAGHFLQTSPEICMKRLLAAGCSKIFQICHCFRNRERGRRHLEEFMMLEWYRLHADYLQLMQDCAALLSWLASNLAQHLPPDSTACFSPAVLAALGSGVRRLSVNEAFARFSPVSLSAALAADQFDYFLVEYVEPHLGQEGPEILYDYPAELASLARLQVDRPNIAERFELYFQGIELANGFSELTDPSEQRQRFVVEIAAIGTKYQPLPVLPERFLTDLAAIPSAAGIALGLDRLVMILLGADTIEQAVSFASGDH